MAKLESEEFKLKLKQIREEENQILNLEKTEKQLDKYDTGEIFEQRSWFLTKQDKKAVKDIVKMTNQGDLTKKDASGLMRQRKIKQELMKTQRGKQAKLPKKHEQHELFRKIKKQARVARQEGTLDRQTKFDAKKLK